MSAAVLRVLVLGIMLGFGCTSGSDSGRVTPEMAASALCFHAPFLGHLPQAALLGDSPIRNELPAGFVEKLALALRGDAELFRIAGEKDLAAELDNYIETMLEGLDKPRADLQVFLRDDASEEETADIETALSNDPGVRRVTFVSRAEAYEDFKRIFENKPALVENVSVEDMPESFEVDLTNVQEADTLRARIQPLPGVDEVKDAYTGLALPAPPSFLTETCRPGFFGFD